MFQHMLFSQAWVRAAQTSSAVTSARQAGQTGVRGCRRADTRSRSRETRTVRVGAHGQKERPRTLSQRRSPEGWKQPAPIARAVGFVPVQSLSALRSGGMRFCAEKSRIGVRTNSTELLLFFFCSLIVQHFKF